jgi:cysteine desulfurase
MRNRRDQLQQGITKSIAECFVVGANAERLPHTLSIAFPGVERQALQLALDLAGVACSTGSACASGSSQPSHVLQAMQLAPSIIRGGIRFSVSADTLDSEIEQTVQILRNILPRLRDKSPCG